MSWRSLSDIFMDLRSAIAWNSRGSGFGLGEERGKRGLGFGGVTETDEVAALGGDGGLPAPGETGVDGVADSGGADRCGEVDRVEGLEDGSGAVGAADPAEG